MAESFEQAMKTRRSYYAIRKRASIPDEEIEALVGRAVRYTPTAFDSQGNRAVLLLHQHHDRLWEIVLETLRGQCGGAIGEQTKQKVEAFKNGYGTVLYLIDRTVTERLVRQYPLYADRFAVWANQANAMMQFAVWCMLEEKGMGASLQHYDPLIDDAVRKQWALPEHWQLVAEMPFGMPGEEPGEKTFEPLEERFLTFR